MLDELIRKNKLDQNSGFSLPELLMSVAIMAYCLSAILVTYNTTLALNESSRNLTSAVSHANFVLEDIRNTTFTSIVANIGTGNWNWNTATVTTKGLTALNSESVAVTSSGVNPIDITVTVNWKDVTGGRNRARTIKTTISG